MNLPLTLPTSSLPEIHRVYGLNAPYILIAVWLYGLPFAELPYFLILLACQALSLRFSAVIYACHFAGADAVPLLKIAHHCTLDPPPFLN